jgi:multiple sugar transport system permease protein
LTAGRVNRRLQRLAHSEQVAGWAFAAPAMVLITIFGLIPIVWSFVLSFQKSNLLAPERPFVGLDNYQRLADDPLFRDSVSHTVLYTVLFVPLSVGGALLIAVALNRPLRFIRLYRTAVFVPVVASTIATSIIFLQLFDPNFGLINWLLGGVGLGPYGFLQDPDQALYAIVTLTVWGWIGFDVIVFLAALQGVPRELLEAAMIDGATPFGAFRRVVVPLLGPATLFLVVWSTINALQLFDEIYFLTKGGPLFSTYVLVYYVFDLAFQKGLAGYAAAVAYTLFAAILVLTAIQLAIGRRMVHYSS